MRKPNVSRSPLVKAAEVGRDEITDRDEGKARGVCPPPGDAPEEGGYGCLF